MKKLLLFLIGIVTLSCTKQDLAQYQDVTFGYSLIEEHSMTKTIDHTAIKNTISATVPKDIKPAFYFNNDVTQGSNIPIGKTVTMKIGTYGVKWNSTANNIVNVIDGNTHFSKTPLYSIDTEINIVPGVTNYSLPVTFKSFAIVVDATEIQKAEYWALGGQFSSIDFFITVGDNMIIFINGEFTDTGVLKIRLMPADSTRKVTTLLLSNKVTTVGQDKTIHIDYGKYYVLHPDAVTEVGSLFNLNIPEWECGNEEI